MSLLAPLYALAALAIIAPIAFHFYSGDHTASKNSVR